MASNGNQPGWNIKGLTDAEVSAAIHYLDWDSSSQNGAGNSATRGICCTLTILFLEWAAFILLYYHTR